MLYEGHIYQLTHPKLLYFQLRVVWMIEMLNRSYLNGLEYEIMMRLLMGLVMIENLWFDDMIYNRYFGVC